MSNATIKGHVTPIYADLISAFVAKEMEKVLAIAGVVCLLGAGWISADLISSSIKTDGTTWITSALTGDKTYAATLFTTTVPKSTGR